MIFFNEKQWCWKLSLFDTWFIKIHFLCQFELTQMMHCPYAMKYANFLSQILKIYHYRHSFHKNPFLYYILVYQVHYCTIQFKFDNVTGNNCNRLIFDTHFIKIHFPSNLKKKVFLTVRITVITQSKSRLVTISLTAKNDSPITPALIHFRASSPCLHNYVTLHGISINF